MTLFSARAISGFDTFTPTQWDEIEVLTDTFDTVLVDMGEDGSVIARVRDASASISTFATKRDEMGIDVVVLTDDGQLRQYQRGGLTARDP